MLEVMYFDYNKNNQALRDLSLQGVKAQKPDRGVFTALLTGLPLKTRLNTDRLDFPNCFRLHDWICLPVAERKFHHEQPPVVFSYYTTPILAARHLWPKSSSYPPEDNILTVTVWQRCVLHADVRLLLTQQCSNNMRFGTRRWGRVVSVCLFFSHISVMVLAAAVCGGQFTTFVFFCNSV